MIHKLEKKYALKCAELHIQGITTGFISSLGQKFVTALYEVIAEDENSFGFVAIEEDRVIGFVAFSKNLAQLYKYIIFKKSFRFFYILLMKMISVRNIKKICANLFYPKKMEQIGLPEAELLSIAVANDGRGKGIAKKLIDAGFEFCRKHGIEKVKVLVAANNEAANKLYQKCGFSLSMQIDSHGINSNVYVRDLTKELYL